MLYLLLLLLDRAERFLSGCAGLLLYVVEIERLELRIGRMCSANASVWK
jgi:hypothetical protein